jgi:hypothetical protein
MSRRLYPCQSNERDSFSTCFRPVDRFKGSTPRNSALTSGIALDVNLSVFRSIIYLWRYEREQRHDAGDPKIS